MKDETCVDVGGISYDGVLELKQILLAMVISSNVGVGELCVHISAEILLSKAPSLSSRILKTGEKPFGMNYVESLKTTGNG